MGRSHHARLILGEEIYSRLSSVKVLLVGAGGIGCELLKNVVLTGFGNITLLDLDTIDLSNLNRQFLFRKKDVKQSKAMVAARTAKEFNPSVQIRPIYANIKEPEYDVSWFRTFDIVLNALDNIDARRHVNKMCLAAGVPLVESGTAGYLGQVQPILKDRTECFDCFPKPVPKTFPVCTIRSTPSQPIHCIVWAKSYLLPQLFGESEEDSVELDEAEKQGEDSKEIETLRKEAQAFTSVRRIIRSATSSSSHAEQSSLFSAASRSAFNKVFNNDIRQLLAMEDMWRTRSPPTPLDFDTILAGTADPISSYSASNVLNGANSQRTASYADRSCNRPFPTQYVNGKVAGLRDQRDLTLRDNLEMFIISTDHLASRLQNGESVISFDKDDDDTLDFVTASANLRAAAYGIAGMSRWKVKEMAGNIIPAIATTNAIIAGAIVLQTLQVLRKDFNGLRNIHLQLKPEVPLNGSSVGRPAKECGVCRDVYWEILCDPGRVTLGQAVDSILGNGNGNGTGPRDVSVYEDKRLLLDPDFDDNLTRSLESLNVTRGKFLTVVDEEGEWGNLSVAIGILPSSTNSEATLIVPHPLPIPTKVVKSITDALLPVTPRKRNAALMEADEDGLPPSKRSKPNATMKRLNISSPSKSPTKKKKLDEDGLLLLDDPSDILDDEPELIAIE